MFIFALFSVLNGFSIIIYKNDCPFGMIRVWESFCGELSLREDFLFWAKSNAQFVRELSFLLWLYWALLFQLFMTERVLSFRGWQEGEQSEHIERKVRMLISKWKASYHLEKKIRLSFQNDKIIISKWQLCSSFQNDSFA